MLRETYRWLVRRLPPRAAWTVWRAGLLVAARRRGRVDGPDVALARVAWGTSEDELVALVEGLAAQAGGAPWRVLLVSNCDAVHVAASSGCRMEYVPSEAAWSRAFPGGDYDGFLAARGRGIGDSYRIAEVEAPGDTPAALLQALRDGASGSPPRRSF